MTYSEQPHHRGVQKLQRRVTAVITATGRPTLRRAVTSALRQQDSVDVLVVLHRPEAHDVVRRRLQGLRCQVVVTEQASSVAAARNMGARLSTTEYVAFLDERDEWLGDKTSQQLLQAGPEVIVSSRALLVNTSSRIVPQQVYRTGEHARSWAEHLFDSSQASDAHLYPQTSTLLCSRDAALAVPWAEELSHHTDWDWLIRLEAAGYQVVQQPHVLVRIFQDRQQTFDWRASQSWAKSLEELIPPQLVGSFSASVIARRAFASRAWASGCQALIHGIRSGAHRSAVLWGVSGLITRG